MPKKSGQRSTASSHLAFGSCVRPLSVLFLALVVTSFAQNEPDVAPSEGHGVIDTIIVAGNHKTKDYVILDEMTLRKGSQATDAAMQFDKGRIYSLGLFTSVEVSFDTLEGTGLLLVDVKERWFLIPVPIFGFLDGDPKKPFYGAGLLHSNVGGRNQKLFVSAVFGHNPSLSLFFSDPLIDRKLQLFASGRASYSRIRNRSVAEAAKTGNFDERHHDLNATVGKRLDLYQTLSFNIGYRVVRVDDYLPPRTVSAAGRDRFLYTSVNYQNDTRDLREYPMSGEYLNVWATKYGLGESAVDFARFGADARKYFPLPLGSAIAARVHGTFVSGGFVPTYSRVYFGYAQRLRGHFTTVFEGENMAGSSVELRIPILTPRVFVFDALPIPDEFAVWRFGIGLALFGDAGTTWFRGETVALRSVASGYGIGIDFQLPYSTVIRSAYARNEAGDGEFILDFSWAW